MCVTVGNKTATLDYSCLLEFCKAADKAAIKSKFVYLDYDGTDFSLYSEGMSSYAYLKLSAPSEHKSFTAGIDAPHFLTVCKRLYDGTVKFTLEKSKLHIKQGNINVSLAVLSRNRNINIVQGSSLPEDYLDWFIKSIISVSVVDESLKASGIQFPGILFDNTIKSSRLCKFSRTTLSIRSGDPLFSTSYRVVLQDELAACVKAFGNKINDVYLASTGVGLHLTEGTQVFYSLVHDKYPQRYVEQWGLVDSLDLIPSGTSDYVFSANALICAADLVSAVLGELDNFIVFTVVGTNDDGFVWQVEGKAFDGTHVRENVISTSGAEMEPFQLNKKAFLKLLASFKDDVRLCDMNPSVLALSSLDGSSVALLSKVAI